MRNKNFLIVGAGGHAVSVAETVHALGGSVCAFVDPYSGLGRVLFGRPVVPTISAETLEPDVRLVVAVGHNAQRERLFRDLTCSHTLDDFPPLVHPGAAVADSAILGPGTVILQSAVVGAMASIGAGVVVNSGAVVDHECSIGDYASVGPAACLGGRVTVGTGSAICMGSSVKHGLSIGAHTVVGAASYVHHDIPDDVVAYGIPARVIRSRGEFDPYL